MMWRFRLVLLFHLVLFLLVISRLFYWQVVKAEELVILGEKQYGKKVVITPQRGIIYSSDRYPLSTNKLSYLVYGNPKEIGDKKKVADMIAPLLDIESASIAASLDKDLFWVPIKEKVDNEIKNKIEELKIPGIGFEEGFERFYPEASMAATLLGFVGKNDQGEPIGYFGLEGYYDRQLRGKGGVIFQIHDALGRPILSKSDAGVTQIDGRNLILSVDRVVQFMVEKKVKKAVEAYQASGAMVGILDPKTGEIIAMVATPSFDQREYMKYDQTLYKNPFISNTYEPGSTFKALVMAAALDAKVVRPETKCDICEGPVPIGEYKINTWNNTYVPSLTMIETIQRSDNTGMVFAGRKLGLRRFIEYLKKFGIGEYTNIDLQGEVAPSIRPFEEWYPIDFATATFGQGITVTPIELLSAFSALANNGNRMLPHVVKAIETPEKEIISIEKKVINQPVSSATAKVMTEILVNAVNKGESKWAKPKGYRIAGKTGTAQIPIEGKYDPHKTIASFIGFAPADNPKFAMLVVIDRPTTSIYGSETAAPLFFDIAGDLFSYYKISPTVSE